MVTKQDDLLIYGLVHTYPDIFENGDFFLRIGKNSRPHVAYLNRFPLSTRKLKNEGNMIAPGIEHAHCLVM